MQAQKNMQDLSDVDGYCDYNVGACVALLLPIVKTTRRNL
jgi:hypothetical protein